MSSIVYLTNKTTGIKYAYESESFRDPVTHKPKNKRKLIGKSGCQWEHHPDGASWPTAEEDNRDLHIRDSKTACG